VNKNMSLTYLLYIHIQSDRCKLVSNLINRERREERIVKILFQDIRFTLSFMVTPREAYIVDQIVTLSIFRVFLVGTPSSSHPRTS